MDDVRRAVDPTPDEAVAAAARVGGFPSFPHLQKWLASPLADLPALRVAILRNIVVNPIVPYLRYLAWREGLNASCRFGEYDNIVQEAVGGAPELLNDTTDCVLVFHRLETAPRLAFDYAGLSGREVQEETQRLRDAVGGIVAGIRGQTGAMILWQAFEQPLHPALGVVDGQRPGEGQSETIAALNAAVVETLNATRNAYLVDVNRCVARIGGKEFYDARYWNAAKAPYTLHGVREIAAENIKYIRALKGRARKCLVVDCDGVLWGGTIGEDGVAGIKLGTTFPGSAFQEFQQEILNLAHRGVLIALCSKNNADDVWEVFDQHPDMVLRRPHIAAARINWTDKATNLRDIARELNIGVDSLVMLDDSDFEINLIREFAPEVTAIALPAGRPSDYRGLLASCGLFDTLTLSAEDRGRGAAYQAEAERRQLQSEAGDMESFLRSLDITLEIRSADEFALPRVAQLTQKTNQFNLTTRRYSEEDIRRFRDQDNADVVYLRYRDRFGDAGIVGVCILRYDGDAALIDSLMLSCRVLGREVEGAFLTDCLARAAGRGAARAIGLYRPTPKNAQVKDFYSRFGFARLDADASGDRFGCDLAQRPRPEAGLFRLESDAIPEGRSWVG